MCRTIHEDKLFELTLTDHHVELYWIRLGWWIDFVLKTKNKRGLVWYYLPHLSKSSLLVNTVCSSQNSVLIQNRPSTNMLGVHKQWNLIWNLIDCHGLSSDNLAVIYQAGSCKKADTLGIRTNRLLKYSEPSLTATTAKTNKNERSPITSRRVRLYNTTQWILISTASSPLFYSKLCYPKKGLLSKIVHDISRLNGIFVTHIRGLSSNPDGIYYWWHWSKCSGWPPGKVVKDKISSARWWNRYCKLLDINPTVILDLRKDVS